MAHAWRRRVCQPAEVQQLLVLACVAVLAGHPLEMGTASVP